MNRVRADTTTADPTIEVRMVMKETPKKYTDCGRRPVGSGSALFATTTMTKTPSSARTTTTANTSTNTPAREASPRPPPEPTDTEPPFWMNGVLVPLGKFGRLGVLGMGAPKGTVVGTALRMPMGSHSLPSVCARDTSPLIVRHRASCRLRQCAAEPAARRPESAPGLRVATVDNRDASRPPRGTVRPVPTVSCAEHQEP